MTMKRLLKWLFRLFLLAVVLAVILLLSLDSILRLYLQHEIRVRTGMEAEIGKFSLGLVRPTMTMQDFKLFNPPGFSGTPFFNIREIHMEYDPVALSKHRFHVALLRLNLAELDIVKNEAGLTNLFSIAGSVSVQRSGTRSKAAFARQTGLEFTGIDVLNVSIGRFKYFDLKDPGKNREQPVGIDNFVVKDVKSPTDLAGLGLMLAFRGGAFFSSLFDVPGAAGSEK
jgi:uncharacterized protein involved in outer membrane biogenesis